MKDKSLEIFYIFFLFVNIVLIPTTKQQQQEYLPGQYLINDLFLKAEEKNEYLYKAGYYSKSAITNNYNNAQGIILLHDNSVRTFNLNILFVVQTN